MPGTGRILAVLTSHDQLGDTGKETGYYVPEIAHPWEALTAAGYQVELASTKGGAAPATGYDAEDPIQRRFLADPAVEAALADTIPADRVESERYDAVLYVGGHGTMWDFPNHPELARISREVYEAGGVVAAVCHGPAALVGTRLSDGSALVAGREVAAFTNSEEAAVGLTEVVPFALQTALEQEGARHTGAADFEAHVVVDGRLVTGQNPASAQPLGEAVVRVLAARD